MKVKSKTYTGKSVKRLNSKQKHKVNKKIKEDIKRKKNLKKDPGVPDLRKIKQDMLAELQRKKPTYERRQAINSLDKGEKGSNSLLNNPYLPMDMDEETPQEVSASKRRYMKELTQVIESADIIIQVLDARDPLGYRSEELENKVLSFGTKKMIILLNKIDLVPSQNAVAWVNYLSSFYPTVLFKSNTQRQHSHLSSAKLFQKSIEHGEDILKSNKTVGADALMGLIKNYMRSGDKKVATTIAVTGYPNVGKSSVINSLKRVKAVGVSNQPGFTKTVQEVELEKQIKILDSPGVIFSNADDPKMVLRNVKKIEQVEDFYTPIQGIFDLVGAQLISEKYQIDSFNDITSFLTAFALKRGKIKKGGIPCLDTAARLVLQDWVGGSIPYFTTPPQS